MSLWNAVYSVLLCFSVRMRTHPLYEITHKQLAAEFFLSQNSQIWQTLLRTVSISQNASGIQISQNFTAHIGYKFCVICRLLADVYVFSLFAERLLFICENLWEITLPTSLLRSKLCEKKHSQWIKTYADKLLLNLSILWVINLPTSLNSYENTWQNIASYSLNHNWDTSQNTLRN